MGEMSSSGINVTKVKNCLIVTVGDDLSGDALDQTQNVVLDGIHQDGCLEVIFELSGLKFMDTLEFEGLKSISEMAAILGAKTVFSGINPGIIFHLISSNAKTEGIQSSLDLNGALNLLGIANDVR